MSDATAEIDAGDRFGFGENWSRFLVLLDDDRVRAAEESLRGMLGVDRLDGVRLVDIGSGSGLFSLAARNLGAEVVSFDYDPQSVACTAELRRRYHPDDDGWRVSEGSALDKAFLGGLGQFDVVYSWGVLHHTGDMWTALGNVAELVAPGGRLFISIYNNQGRMSRFWTEVKRRYNSAGRVGRWVILHAVDVSFRVKSWRPKRYLRSRGITPGERGRGMDRWHDMIDWVGGWPFEVARPDEVFAFYRERGFVLDAMTTCGGGIGCNQFVFTR